MRKEFVEIAVDEDCFNLLLREGAADIVSATIRINKKGADILNRGFKEVKL